MIDSVWQRTARTIVSGQIAGDMRFHERRAVSRPRRRRGEFAASYAVVDAHGSGVRFLLEDVHVTFASSIFTSCVFEGKRAWPAAGAFGHTSGRSVYRDCHFLGVNFDLHGFSLGWARFERCTFERCRTGHIYSPRADLVGCRFIGRVDNAQLLGADPATGIPNDIRDNDFSNAELGRVSFQAGARPEDQLWPRDVVVERDASGWETVVRPSADASP
ncbi:hypothetical protein [Intrasporangium calvum]|uniref:hypothetical protein n=1 Tax=Intrasporangium calvum TaxID=53358 RepID=UPI002341BA3D|nr:hypothetical protein [Intrasporangium calvum]